MTDTEILQTLNDIDGDPDITVTDWEAEFLNSVINCTSLSRDRKLKALEIIEKYYPGYDVYSEETNDDYEDDDF